MLGNLGKKIREAHWLFLLISLPVTLFFATHIPLTIGLDESIHITRAYNISELNFYPDVDKSDGIPANLHDALVYFKETNETSILDGKYSERLFFQKNYLTELRADHDYKRHRSSSLNSDQDKYYKYTSSGSYSPAIYTPYAIAFFFASLLDLSVGSSIILARVVGAVFAITIVFVALYITRKQKIKWLLFCVALFPSVLYQFSVVTADTYCIAIALLYLSLVIPSILNGRNINLKTLLLIFTVGILLALAKINYIPLLLLTFLLPIKNTRIIGSKTISSKLVKLFMFGVPIVIALVFALATSHPEYVNAWGTGSPDNQIRYLAARPWYFLQVLYNTISSASPGWGSNMYGVFAYLPGMSISTISQTALIISMVVSAIYASRKLTARLSYILLASSIISITSIYAALYVSFTPAQYPLVNGVQARYFIPLLPAIMLGLAGLVKIRFDDTKKTNKRVIGLVVFISIFVLIDTLFTFWRVLN